jgi:hypothetical protein
MEETNRHAVHFYCGSMPGLQLTAFPCWLAGPCDLVQTIAIMPSIFLLQNKTKLIEMTEQQYESEDLLQALVADHPSVLAGDQFNGAEPRRWLLIAREASVPCQDGGSGRWSLDHLFVDQYGIPTLVEVKRSSDTRIRREVIGQMFDYAANAVVYWPAGEIRSIFERNCEAAKNPPDQRLAQFLQATSSTEGDTDGRELAERFWKDVDVNLRAGRIRMVFVADLVPTELRRIVEFLNGQMNPAEVLAIEIKQFAGSNVTTLVPTVIGQNAQATAQRDGSIRSKKQWTKEAFFEALRAGSAEQSYLVAERLCRWCDDVLPLASWGAGSQAGSSFGIKQNAKKIWLLAIWTNGNIEFQLRTLRNCPPFDAETKRLELLEKIKGINGVSITPDDVSGYPSFDLSMLVDSAAEEKLRLVIEWAVEQITSA